LASAQNPYDVYGAPGWFVDSSALLDRPPKPLDYYFYNGDYLGRARVFIYGAEWHKEGDPTGLYNPIARKHVLSHWDDGGETHPFDHQGPNLYLDLKIPAGWHELSLYFIDPDWHHTEHPRHHRIKFIPSAQYGIPTASVELIAEMKAALEANRVRELLARYSYQTFGRQDFRLAELFAGAHLQFLAERGNLAALVETLRELIPQYVGIDPLFAQNLIEQRGEAVTRWLRGSRRRRSCGLGPRLSSIAAGRRGRGRLIPRATRITLGMRRPSGLTKSYASTGDRNP